MAVKELESKGLRRKIEVKVPGEIVKGHVDAYLGRKGASVRLPGFRPGKAPRDILISKFGAEALHEAISYVVDAEAKAFFKKSGLNPAGQPSYVLVETPSLKDMSKELVFTLEFECVPEVKDVTYDDLKLSKAVVKVADKEVKALLDEWVKGSQKTVPLKKARPTKEGDVVVVDIEVTRPDKKVDNASDMSLSLTAREVGAELLADFVGKKVGDEVTRKTLIPKREADKTVAGKKLPTRYHIKGIKERVPLEGPQDLPELLGEKDVAAVEAKARDILEKKGEQLAFFWLKRQVLDYFADRYMQEMPENLVESEYKRLWRNALAEAGLSEKAEPANANDDKTSTKEQKEADAARIKAFRDNFDRTEKELEAFFKKVSKRRVCLGFVLSKLGSALKVSVTEDELKGALTQEMQRYPGQEEEMLNYYRQNRGALDALRAPLFEDKVVRALIEAKPPKSEEKFSLEGLEARLEKEESTKSVA